MNIVCWGNGLQRFVPLRDQSGETLRTANRNNWLKSYGRPRILVVDQQRSLCSGTFAKKVESDGKLLEVTPLEAEPAGKDWKEDKANCMLDNTSGFDDVERMQPRSQQTLYGTRAWSSATRWPQIGLPTAVPLSSVHDPRCDRFARTKRRHTNTSRNT